MNDNERRADPTPANDTREAPPEKVELEPRARIAKASRAVFLGGALLGLVILTVLSFHYSREGLDSQAPEPPRAPSPVPLATEQLEKLRPPAPPPVLDLGPELEGLVAPEEPEPAPRGAAPWRFRPAPPAKKTTRSAPLAVSLPAHPHRAGRSDLASAASRLSRQSQALLTQPRRATENDTAPEAADPRQLAAPETNVVRVTLEEPATPWVIQAGTYVEAVLTQAVSSEIGGPVRARIARDVRDSQTLTQVLIPRGSLVLGRQSRQPLLGERRLLILWERLILPDGRSFDLSEEPAAGLDGTLGVLGRTNNRWGKRFGAAALLSVVGAGLQLGQPQRSGDFGQAATSGQTAAGAAALELGRLSQEILRQLINLPPTVSLSPGARVHLLLTRDLAFETRPVRR